MAVCIQENGLGSGINSAGRRYARIEGYGYIYVELVLYLRGSICSIIQDDDSKGYLIAIFFCKRFEIWNIKAGTGAVRVKEMYEHRFVPGNGDFPLKVNSCSRPDRMILFWNRGGKAVFPVGVPENVCHATKNSHQPCYGNCLFHQYIGSTINGKG